MLAARFSQPGAVRPVSFSQRYEVKWLQFLVRRLYDFPWNSREAYCALVCLSTNIQHDSYLSYNRVELFCWPEREAM
jgi:hypothetical protein